MTNHTPEMLILRRRHATRAVKAVAARLGVAAALLAAAAIALAAAFCSEGCATATIRPNAKDYRAPVSVKMTTTGYCNCRKCCDWKYTWYGKPVTLSGRPKKVGLTASGVRAHAGTIAADTSLYPFGTIIEIPGYGYGRVEDRGGGIKKQHIDLWFPRHKDALEWGKREKIVKVWLPK